MLATLVYFETAKLAANENSPIHKFFADFAGQLQ